MTAYILDSKENLLVVNAVMAIFLLPERSLTVQAYVAFKRNVKEKAPCVMLSDDKQFSLLNAADIQYNHTFL